MYNTLLVNKNNIIKQSKIDRIIMDKYLDCDGLEILVEKNTLKSFIKLRDFFLKKGIDIQIESGFRTIKYQEELINRLMIEKGEDYVNNYVALPGYSEHHTGMALDIIVNGLDDNYLLEEVHRQLHKFGFILRYPKDKEEITGYSYEAWHIRYVGCVPAKIMYDKNLCLEEYLTKFGCVLYINKPVGVTSFDVVNEVSYLFGIKRVGHTGTLDPMASGVLIVCIGTCTKIASLLTAHDKEYIAGVKLGLLTDTLDTTGEVIDNCEVGKIDIKSVLETFKKTYMQEVPIYSAVKVNGKKLYEYARNKMEVDLPKKEVTIKKIELLENTDNNSFTFKCLVTKGCYIRSLIRDIGDSINTYASMSSLIRTRQGSVDISQTDTIEDIKNNKFNIYSLFDVLDYPVIKVDEELSKKLRNGVKVSNNWNITDKVIFVDNHDNLIGIYMVDGEVLKTWKNF